MRQSTEPVTSQTFFYRPEPMEPMRFAPMAVSSRVDRGYHNMSKISFWPFFRLTFRWSDLTGEMVRVHSSIVLYMTVTDVITENPVIEIKTLSTPSIFQYQNVCK